MTVNRVIDGAPSESFETSMPDSLTYDKWKKWYYETYLESDASESFPLSEWDKWLSKNKSEDRIYRDRVNRMQSSVLLRENFLLYPVDLQKRIMSQVLGNGSMRLVEECTKTFLIIQEQHRDATDCWFEGTPESIRNIIHSLPTAPSDDFIREAERFGGRKYRNSVSNWSEITPVVCEMMWMLYGEDTSIEVLTKFNNAKQSCNMQLIELMHRWEELKDYPFDWVLSVLSTDVK